MTNLPPPASLVLIPDVYDSVWTDLGGVYYWLGESWNECAFRLVHTETNDVIRLDHDFQPWVQPWPPTEENQPPIEIATSLDAVHIACDRAGKLTWTRKDDRRDSYIDQDRLDSLRMAFAAMPPRQPSMTAEQVAKAASMFKLQYDQNQAYSVSFAPPSVVLPQDLYWTDGQSAIKERPEPAEDPDASLSYDEWSRKHTWGVK